MADTAVHKQLASTGVLMTIAMSGLNQSLRFLGRGGDRGAETITTSIRENPVQLISVFFFKAKMRGFDAFGFRNI